MTKPAAKEQTMDEPTVTTTAESDVTAVEPQVEDVLVEEVSIDGMCGVY